MTRPIAIAGLAALLVGFTAAPCSAWRFSLKGDFEYRYRYISRTGPRDLFGNANVGQANGTAFIGLAGPMGGGVVRGPLGPGV
jgi:hypothetical protein